MKTITPLILSVLAVVFNSTAAVKAGDTATDHRLLHRHIPVVLTNSKANPTGAKVNEERLVYREVSTGQGTIGFFAPAR